MSDFDFIVLGQSHAVAFLDGVTNWREKIKPTAQDSDDPLYGGAFQGWRTGAFPDDPLELSITEPGLSSRSILAWAMPASGTKNIKSSYEVRDGQKLLSVNRSFLDVLKGLPAKVPIVSFMNGNEHAGMMLGTLPPYDFLEPWLPGLNTAPNVVPIDSIFIDEIVKSWMLQLLPRLTLIQRETGSRLIHVLPPPPRENPQASTYLESWHEFVRKYGFAPDAIRLKWYRRYCRMLMTVLKPMGCEVLLPPRQALTDAGLLKSSLAEGVTHANAAYGKHLAHALEEKIRGGK